MASYDTQNHYDIIVFNVVVLKAISQICIFLATDRNEITYNLILGDVCNNGIVGVIPFLARALLPQWNDTVS